MIKQARWVKSTKNREQLLRYQYGEAWQIDHCRDSAKASTTHSTMEVTTVNQVNHYPVNHSTAQNTILSIPCIAGGEELGTICVDAWLLSRANP